MRIWLIFLLLYSSLECWSVSFAAPEKNRTVTLGSLFLDPNLLGKISEYKGSKVKDCADLAILVLNYFYKCGCDANSCVNDYCTANIRSWIDKNINRHATLILRHGSKPVSLVSNQPFPQVFLVKYERHVAFLVHYREGWKRIDASEGERAVTIRPNKVDDPGQPPFYSEPQHWGLKVKAAWALDTYATRTVPIMTAPRTGDRTFGEGNVNDSE